MKTVRDIPELAGKRVLLRTALNVPVENGAVMNTFRLRSALPTIEYLRERGARLVLVSHISGSGSESLEPMWRAMQEFIPDIRFVPAIVGDAVTSAIDALPAGGVLMLENLRQHPGEEKNDPAFAKELASLADLFVQDTFDICHRKHAAVVGVPQFLPSYAGFLVETEVQNLSGALSPISPSLAILSGAKFATKEPVIVRLISVYDRVFVGGALANDFIKAKGYSVGASLVSGEREEDIRSLLESPRLMIPVDVIVAPKGGARAEGRVCELSDIQPHEAILDVGPKTNALLADVVASAQTVLWNGPLGNYENGFTEGTEALARAIAASSARSAVGGGDTIAAIEHLGITDKISFLSTGGGAMLDFLSEGTLPGIEALS